MANDFMIPNVTTIPGQSGVGGPERGPGVAERAKIKGEFDSALGEALKKDGAPTTDLTQARDPLKFSAHASQRLKDRKIQLDAATMSKVNDAIDRAGAKGIEDGLILTKDAALIVSIKNRTVVTAMDRAQMTGNVFTNIDGAIII